MKIHYNKKYNFAKGYTLLEIVTFTYIFLLSILAFAGIFTIFATAIIDTSAFDAFNETGFELK